jgi:uncharacterized protein
MGEEKNPGLAEFRFSPRPNKANDIHWQSWGPEPFATGNAENKPILLALSAVWCHWCHVMDEQGYSTEDIIQILNERYVPVRVDRDLRPDIDRRYNMGGWPTIALLSPAGEVITGGTYVPPGQLRNVLQKVSQYFTEDSEGLEQEMRETAEATAGEMKKRTEKATPKGEIIWGAVADFIAEALVQTHDPMLGGFGEAPKFPNVEALEFALDLYQSTDDVKWAKMVELTIESMNNGEIYDWDEGGFFRYAQTKEWGSPHYEKMLEDNAKLIRIYTEMNQLVPKGSYKFTVKSIMGYLDTVLYQPGTGAFGGSQDADEEYYKLKGAERKQAAAPFVDPTIYTDWNAMTASAYFLAGEEFKDAHARQAAIGVLDFLWKNCYDEKAGMYHYWDGQPRVSGLLNDQVTTATAMLDAFEVTEDRSYLEKARALGKVIMEGYYDPEEGGFFDTAAGRPAEGQLKERIKVMDENAWTVIFFDRLAEFTQDEDDKAAMKSLLKTTLKVFLPTFRAYGVQAGAYGQAVERHIRNTEQ